MAKASSTHWSCIIGARNSDGSKYHESWLHLIDKYRPVIKGYLFKCGAPKGEIEDWCQEMFTKWVGGGLDGADREKGKFRTFLRGAAWNFCKQKYRDNKNRPPLHQITDMPDDSPGIDDAFDREFIYRIYSLAKERLKMHQDERNAKGTSKAEANKYFTLLDAYVIDPDCAEERPTADDLAERYDMTKKGVQRQLDRARELLKQYMREEVRDATGNSTAEREEWLFLESVLGA